LRVSTNKQADKDADPEGYSLPAQREACQRKAEQLGAEIVDEYMDRGESAKTTDRPQFQTMLRRIQEDRDIDYVILDKVNRFARNRRDDANVLFELRKAGCQLVSVKENIDETPAGMLMHGILATIAEYESRNNGAEALKGMTRKAKVGGTPGRAPIGYLNVGRRHGDGEEHRVVVVDPERAPLVQWAFEAYATGEWTISTLTAALQEKGLKALPHGRIVGRAVQRSHVAHLLSNRYYIGTVTFNGVENPEGKHQPIVSQSLFDAVQEVLTSHRAGEKQRVHRHYLRSTLYCANCGNRLCFMMAKQRYPYFFCIGRQMKRAECPQRWIPAEELEEAVASYWKTVRLPQELQEVIREGLRAELDYQDKRAKPEIAWAKRRVTELEQESRNLSRGVVTGSIPPEHAREEQDRIRKERQDAEKVLGTTEMVFARIEDTLNRALGLVGSCDEVYRQGGPRIRRLANQFFFEKLLISERTVAGAVLREPWATIQSEQFQRQMARSRTNPGRGSSGRSFRMMTLVPPGGFEPPTHGLGIG